MPDSYRYEELLEELDDTYFEGEPITSGPEAESDVQRKLREIYVLPNIQRDEDAIKAVIEYGSSKNGERLTLDQLGEYAGLFVQFYENWTAVADEYLEDHFPGIESFYDHMDRDEIGRALSEDLGGYWGYEEDGRVACFNKKEGE